MGKPRKAPGEGLTYAEEIQYEAKRVTEATHGYPNGKGRSWAVHLTPELWLSAGEALKLPRFGGVRNALMKAALTAYLRHLYKKGEIGTSPDTKIENPAS